MPTKSKVSRILSWFKHQTRLAKFGMVIGIFSVIGVVFTIVGVVTGWLKYDSPPTKTLIADHGVVIADSANAHVEYSVGDKFVNSSSVKIGANYGTVILNVPANTGFHSKESSASTATNESPTWLEQKLQKPHAEHRPVMETSQLIFKQLQAFLGTDGFTVKSPYTFLEEGKEVGRVDIGIYGKVGSFGQSLYAIEFKKSQNDDVAWIHQLRGKREAFKIDRMMAASTIGFTPAAVRAADQLGIELVCIDDRESVVITNWMQTLESVFHSSYWNTNGFINVRTEPPYQSSFFLNAAKPILREEGSTNFVSVPDYIAHDIDQLLNSLTTNEVKDVVLAYVTPQGTGPEGGSFSTDRPLTTNDTVVLIPFKHPVDVAVDWRMSRLVSMSLPVRLRSELERSKVILSVYRNMTDGSVLGMGGIVSHMVPSANRFGQIRAKTLILVKEGKIQMQFFNENYEPMYVTNLYLEVWGRN